MYAYFIDSWVFEKCGRKMDKLDLGLTQKGASGRKIKMSRLHDLPSSIKECSSSGIKTFVAVGDDDTASRVMNACLKTEGLGFVFSYVPMCSEKSEISKTFGYSTITECVDALSHGRTAKIDVGVLSGRHYFITAAVFGGKCSLVFETYSISSLLKNHHISVCNSNIYSKKPKHGKWKFSLYDGMLDAVIAAKPEVSFLEKMIQKNDFASFSPDSVFLVDKITIKSKQKTVSVLADSEKQLSSPIVVEVAPKHLEIIIGDKFHAI